MKVVVFESEPREAPALDRLKPAHEVRLIEERLRGSAAGECKDAEIISTFIDSELGRDVLGQFPSLRVCAPACARAGADIWVNTTPLPPLEASGASGM